MPRSDPPGFQEWFQSVTSDPDAPTDDPGEVSPEHRRWLRRFFEAEGAASQEVTHRAFMSQFVALANEAVAAVLGDLHRTAPLRPRVVVDVWMEYGIRISIDDGYTAPSMWEIEQPEAFAEVADYFQDQLGQTLGCWPVCQEHDLGLHAEVHDGTAVWWCRRMQHSVARIGSLGLEKPRRANRKPKRS